MKKPNNYWTKERVLEEAKKYSTKKEWRTNSSSSYGSAHRNFWIEEASKHMVALRKRDYWTKEIILKEAKKYKTRSEWKKKSHDSYKAAQYRNLLDEASKHMVSVQNKSGYWTKERVLEEAKKYKTRSEWGTNSLASYTKAHKSDWIEEATLHMEVVGSKYKRCIYLITVDNTKYAYIGLTYNLKRRFRDHLKTKRFLNLANQYGKESIKVKQLTIFLEKGEASKLEKELINEYKENGFIMLNEVRGGSLGGIDIKWTKERVLEEAKKYSTKKEWREKSPASYSKAHKSGWVEIASIHMVSLKGNPRKWPKEKGLEEAKKYKTRSEWKSNSGGSYRSAKKFGWFDEATKHMVLLRKRKKKIR